MATREFIEAQSEIDSSEDVIVRLKDTYGSAAK
jgi:hypothetical protein